MPRGRPKKSKSTTTNISFWKGMLKDGKIPPFLERGNTAQKETIKAVLKYLKKADIEFFNQVNGQQILKEINNQFNRED